MSGRVCLLAFSIVLAVGLIAYAEDTGPGGEDQEVVANPIVFWELASTDADKSVEFFRKVFGWDIRFSEKLGFYEAPVGKASDYFSMGYIFTLSKPRLPFLTLYILVDDIEAKAALIEESGGLVTEPPHDIGSGAYICLFNDPSGVTFAMFQSPKAAATGEE